MWKGIPVGLSSVSVENHSIERDFCWFKFCECDESLHGKGFLLV